MGRRRKKHVHLHQTGVTPEGRKVFGGVYSFYESEGLPLDELFAQLWDRDMLPDWVALVQDMTRAGRPLDRTFESIRAAVNDACYPTNFRDGIQAGLNDLQRVMESVKTNTTGDRVESMSRKPSQSLVGRRIKLVKCNDSFTKLEPGAEGTVEMIDDLGTLHVKWDNGAVLGLVWDDGDRWTIITQA